MSPEFDINLRVVAPSPEEAKRLGEILENVKGARKVTVRPIQPVNLIDLLILPEKFDLKYRKIPKVSIPTAPSQSTPEDDKQDDPQLEELRNLTFGKLLTILREASVLSQVDLAHRAHLSSAYLNRVEREIHNPPTPRTARTIVSALGLDEEHPDAQLLMEKALQWQEEKAKRREHGKAAKVPSARAQREPKNSKEAAAQSEESDSSSFGKLLKNFREESHLSQEDLAQAANFDYTYLGRVEREIYNPPKPSTTRAIISAFGWNEEDPRAQLLMEKSLQWKEEKDRRREETKTNKI